jgi:hypothetical protein
MSRSYLVILIACLGSAASALADGKVEKPRPVRPLDYEIKIQELDLERGRLLMARAQIFLKDLAGIEVPGTQIDGFATESDYQRLEVELRFQRGARIAANERPLPGMRELSLANPSSAIQRVLTAPMVASLADFDVTLREIYKKRKKLGSKADESPEFDQLLKLAEREANGEGFWKVPDAAVATASDKPATPTQKNVVSSKGPGSKSKAAK